MPEKTSKKHPDIPTFAANGDRLRDYSLRAVERLLAIDRVVVERNKHGKILCATLRPLSGANPVYAGAHMGQSYSYEQPLPSGHCAWKHRDLPGRGDIEALFGELNEHELRSREMFVRAVFRAVPLSCLRTSNERTARAVGVVRDSSNVLSIAAANPSPAHHRPIEFDSEMRAA